MRSALTRQRLISGVSWFIHGRVLAVIAIFIVNAVLARLLSPQSFGSYALLWSLISFFGIIAQLGLSQLTTKYVAEAVAREDVGAARGAVRDALIYCGLASVATALSFVALSLIYLVDALHMQMPGDAVIVGGIWVGLVALSAVLAAAFRGLHDIRYATFFGGALSNVLFATALGVVWLAGWSPGLTALVGLGVVAWAVNVAAGLKRLMRKFEAFEVSEKNTKVTISVGWSLLVTNATLFLLSQIALWIIGAFGEQSDVALYAAAQKLVAFLSFPLLALSAVVPPIIAEFNAAGRLGDLEKTLRTSTSYASLVSGLVWIVFMLAGEEILSFSFGHYYSQAYPVMVVLAFGQLVNVLAGPCGQVLMMTGQQKMMMTFTLGSGIFTTALAYVLIGYGGVVGVAVAVTAGLCVLNFAALAMVRRSMGIWTHLRLPALKRAARD